MVVETAAIVVGDEDDVDSIGRWTAHHGSDETFDVVVAVEHRRAVVLAELDSSAGSAEYAGSVPAAASPMNVDLVSQFGFGLS